MSGRKLARNVIKHSAGKLEPYIKKFLTSSWAGDGGSSNDQIDHHGIIFDIYQCAPKVLKVVVPYITGELLVRSYSGSITTNGSWEQKLSHIFLKITFSQNQFKIRCYRSEFKRLVSFGWSYFVG